MESVEKGVQCGLPPFPCAVRCVLCPSGNGRWAERAQRNAAGAAGILRWRKIFVVSSSGPAVSLWLRPQGRGEGGREACCPDGGADTDRGWGKEGRDALRSGRTLLGSVDSAGCIPSGMTPALFSSACSGRGRAAVCVVCGWGAFSVRTVCGQCSRAMRPCCKCGFSRGGVVSPAVSVWRRGLTSDYGRFVCFLPPAGDGHWQASCVMSCAFVRCVLCVCAFVQVSLALGCLS